MEANIVCCLVLAIIMSEAKSITVFESTSPIGDFDTLSGLRLITDHPNINVLKFSGIAACAAFNFKRLLLTRSKLIAVQSLTYRVVQVMIGYDFSFVNLGNFDSYGSSTGWILKLPSQDSFYLWSANRWHRICVSYTKSNSYIRFVKDGMETIVDFEDKNINLEGVGEDFLQHVYVGRCPNPKDDCSRHGGQFTDINIWSKALTKQEMLDWTSCKNDLKGDLVNWDTAEWEMVNMTKKTIDADILCKGQAVGHVLVPGGWDMDSGILLCKQLGGQTSVVTNKNLQLQLADIYANHSSCIARDNWYWAGWWDRPTEGTFENVNNEDQRLTNDKYSLWGLGEPNGNRQENCATVRTLGFWNDMACGLKTCAFCELGESPIYIMRGLCEDSYFDVHYGWTGEMSANADEKYTFRGFSKSILTWDFSLKLWKLETYKDPGILAYLNETGVEYPFGTRKWYVYNDTCSKAKEPTIRSISFSVCNETQFNCRDGTCIDLFHRCDGVMHCEDKSDEIECERIITGPAYIKELPPPPKEGKKPILQLSAKMYSILAIAEVDSLVKFQLRLTLSWKDSRLKYYNLNKDVNLNSLTEREKSVIWFPSLIFANTVSRYHARFDSDRSLGTISMKDENGTELAGEKSPFHNYLNTKIFQGKNCPIEVSNFFSKDFICLFDMALYPFDTQYCRATFLLKGTDRQLVTLVNGTLTFAGSYNVLQYVIRDIKFQRNMPDGLMTNSTNSVSIEIKLGRRLLSVILTSFVPTFILVLVSFTTNFVSNEHFKAIVTVNLTAMLVIVTLFISDAKSLPKTAYMKMIDIWAITTMSIPFFAVVIHTVNDLLRVRLNKAIKAKGDLDTSKVIKAWNDNDLNYALKNETLLMAIEEVKRVEGYQKSMKIFARYILPVMFAIFAIGFFIAGKMALDSHDH